MSDANDLTRSRNVGTMHLQHLNNLDCRTVLPGIRNTSAPNSRSEVHVLGPKRLHAVLLTSNCSVYCQQQLGLLSVLSHGRNTVRAYSASVTDAAEEAAGYDDHADSQLYVEGTM